MPSQFVRLQGLRSAAHPARRGFTLIELMLTVVIIAILAAIAVPAYQQYMFRARRADATSVLGNIQLAQERYRANQPEYTSSLSTLGFGSDVSPQGHYKITIKSAAATGYVLQAEAQSTSPQIRDSDCRKFELEMKTGNTLYRAESYSAGASAASTKCWPK